MPLTTSEISSIRTCFEEETLQDTAVISRPTKTPDGQGGRTAAWADIATVPARIGPGQRGASSVEGTIADRVGGANPVIVNLPAETDVTLADRVTILGRVLEVVGSDAPRSWEFTRQLICVEVT